MRLFRQGRFPIVMLLVLQACAPSSQTEKKETIATEEIILNSEEQFQEIEHFGASDAWACQFVGNWPDAKKNAIADLLFSTDTLADGSPRGIGLSIWRFNIGGGSIELGDASGIRDEWRRAEGFLQPDGQLDFNSQSGQTWFLSAAKQRGVPNFLGFVNSPPVYMTRTGKAFAANATGNLAPETYPAYASFIASVVKGIKAKTGVEFRYISPVNEPQNDWSDGGQEGSPYKNEEIFGIARALNEEFNRQALPTQLVFSETFEIKYLLRQEDKPGRENQLTELFTPGSAYYLGQFDKVAKRIAYHAYFSSSPQVKAVQLRKELAGRVESLKDYKVWQSEYCVLGDNDGELKGEKRDLGMETALYVSRLIHNDLVYANATAWHWWLAVSPYDYKDGLVYVDKNKTDGNYYPSKLLWAMGNYSRFVRPGMVRISASFKNQQPSGVLVSAYKNPVTRETVVILTNSESTEKQIEIKTTTGNSLVGATTKMYATSGTAALTKSVAENGKIKLPAKSVVSIVL